VKRVLQKADTRGLADHGWLQSRHTFSFANYHDPERMGFGLLRVINDDIVQPSKGFDTHPHKNMEIVSIPISGELRHHDSMGNTQHIRTGEVQIMSAGAGITHSEYNASDSELVAFLQIWVLPKFQNIEPRYGQQLFSCNDRKNKFQIVVSPDKDNNNSAIRINQDTWFLQGDFDTGQTGSYRIKREGNGMYFFVIEGAVTIADENLQRRDAIGFEDAAKIDFEVTEDCQLLIIDVPMQ
jgi:redox-sensitive bicupin YhaK (pirin superfamily)